MTADFGDLVLDILGICKRSECWEIGVFWDSELSGEINFSSVFKQMSLLVVSLLDGVNHTFYA
jgi:hypothetical protein